MAIHQSPGFSLPSFRMKQLSTATWGAGGNTATITDPYIFPNSAIMFLFTGNLPAGANWKQVCAEGSATITSTDPESSALTFSYIVL